MVQVDLPGAIAAGQIFAILSRGFLEKEDKLFTHRLMGPIVAYFALIYAPVGMYLIFGWPAWESMYWWEWVEKPAFHPLVAFFYLFFYLSMILLGIGSYMIGHRLYRMGMERAVHVLAAAGVIATLLPFVLWPFTWLFVGTYSDFHAVPRQTSIMFLTPSFFLPWLLVMSYLVVGSLRFAGWLWKYAIDGERSEASMPAGLKPTEPSAEGVPASEGAKSFAGAALFTPASIGSLELVNRMIRTASHEGLADALGAPTEEQFQFYKGFVDGGIGLIITGYAGVMQNGKSSLYHMTMIHKDELVPAHRTMVEKIHEAGGKIVLQIAHCGRQTRSRETGAPAIVAPSPIPNFMYPEIPKALSESEIFEIVEAFARAAARAKEAGYDGVEIHAAHGYLLSSFLSRHSNKRKDSWGGELENRFRIVGETLRAVKNAVGPDYPVLTKINSYEQAIKGIRAEECVQIAQLIEQTGCCDAIEVSAGTNENVFIMARGDLAMEGILKYYRPFCNMPEWAKNLTRIVAPPVVGLFIPPFRQGYNLETAAMVKKAVSLPVITVGGMRSKHFMEAAVRQGKTDFVSMARPLLVEPDLANRFKTGVSDTALCNNCNVCVVATDTVPIRCHDENLLKQAGNIGGA